MGTLTYSMNCSLDGYSADADGNVAWLEPTEDFLASQAEDLEDAAAVLCGRRMYETLAVWETDRPALVGSPGSDRFAAAWTAVPKVVFFPHCRTSPPAGRLWNAP